MGDWARQRANAIVAKWHDGAPVEMDIAAALREAERRTWEKAIGFVQEARAGEIDTDFRSIIACMRYEMEKDDADSAEVDAQVD